MSDPGPRTTAPARPIRRRVLTAAFVAPLVIAACGAVAPFLLDAFWLQVGLFAMAAAVAALGLELLIGQAGQLSLAHSFFIMIGAYAYTYGASDSQTVGVSTQDGLGLPPIVAVAVRGAALRRRRPRVLADRGTSARRVPRRRVARARVPRPAHPVQLAEHHRRVQRPRRPSVHAVRLHVRRRPRRDHRPGSARSSPAPASSGSSRSSPCSPRGGSCATCSGVASAARCGPSEMARSRRR